MTGTQRQLIGVLGVCSASLLFPPAVHGFDQSDLKQAKETCQCAGCDLSGADLAGFNPAKAAANGTPLACKFDNADLSGANLTNVNMQGDSRYDDFVQSVSFQGADLQDADLSGAWIGSPSDVGTFKGANLEGATLRNAALYGLRNATLKNADMAKFHSLCGNMSGVGSTFEGADLSGANLDDARLCVYFFNTDFTGATLQDATIEITVDTYASFGTAAPARQMFTDKNETEFRPGAAFAGVDLTDANLTGAQITGDVSYAGNDGLLAILSQATLCNTTLPDGTKSNRDC